MGADGTGGDFLTIPASGVEMPPTDALRENGMAYAKMDGKEVYKFAVKAMPHAAELALKRSELYERKTSTSLFPIRPTSASSSLRRNGSTYRWKRSSSTSRNNANTSGASIPIALDEAVHAGMIHRGDIVCLDGFGAGLTWASLVMKWY